MRYAEVIWIINTVTGKSLPTTATLFLYGSRAQGDANADFDGDILILLDKDRIELSDYDNIAFPFTSLGWDINEMIVPVLYTKKDWESMTYLPFYKNVEHDKIVF